MSLPLCVFGLLNVFDNSAQSPFHFAQIFPRDLARFVPAFLDRTQCPTSSFDIFDRKESFGFLKDFEFYFEVLFKLFIFFCKYGVSCFEECVLSCAEPRPQRIVIFPSRMTRCPPAVHELAVSTCGFVPVG